MSRVATADRLAGEVRALKKRVAHLEKRNGLIVPVQTLAPEPFELLQEMKVVVEPAAGDYVASFVDASVNASGSTPNDAVANLKDLLIGLYDSLTAQPPKKLGRGPARQLAVLKSFLRRVG